jgi:hypothetical protein
MITKDNRPPVDLRTLKRGQVRNDGKIFVQYAPDRKDGEWWATPMAFEKMQKQSSAAKKKYKKSDKGKASQRKYESKKRQECPAFRFSKILRDRVRYAIKAQCARKSSQTHNLIGCSLESLRVHLESHFQEGMTWENYGSWHIDHIRPCASFNLLDE